MSPYFRRSSVKIVNLRQFIAYLPESYCLAPSTNTTRGCPARKSRWLVELTIPA
jgi:hypothetical protein